jgi:GNAT superfamily N-acetyltransferase
VAKIDAHASLLMPFDHAARRVIRPHRLYFLLLKHDLLDPERSPVPRIRWRPLVGPHPIDARMIRATATVDGRTDRTVAEMSYQVCGTCRRGMIWKVATEEGWRHQGIAAAMIERGRRRADRHMWWTSEQLPDAVPFWIKIGERTGLGYEPGEECKHMRRVGFVNARDRIHLYSGGRD